MRLRRRVETPGRDWDRGRGSRLGLGPRGSCIAVVIRGGHPAALEEQPTVSAGCSAGPAWCAELYSLAGRPEAVPGRIQAGAPVGGKAGCDFGPGRGPPPAECF